MFCLVGLNFQGELVLKIHTIYESATGKFVHSDLKKQLRGHPLQMNAKCMEMNTNENCEQNCCEDPSEREASLIRMAKRDVNNHVGLGILKQDMK